MSTKTPLSLLVGIAFVFILVTSGPSTSAYAEVNVGDYPDIVLTDLAGDQISLTRFRGEVVLVDIWATWCAPCRQSMPFYREIYRAKRDDGFRILAISVDEDRRAVVDFRSRHDIPFLILLDPAHKAVTDFAPPTMPTAYLIDRHGEVRFRHTGFRDADRDILREHIEKLLAEPLEEKGDK